MPTFTQTYNNLIIPPGDNALVEGVTLTQETLEAGYLAAQQRGGTPDAGHYTYTVTPTNNNFENGQNITVRGAAGGSGGSGTMTYTTASGDYFTINGTITNAGTWQDYQQAVGDWMIPPTPRLSTKDQAIKDMAAVVMGLMGKQLLIVQKCYGNV